MTRICISRPQWVNTHTHDIWRCRSSLLPCEPVLNAYRILNQIFFYIWTPYEIYYTFQCMSKTFWVEFWRASFIFQTKSYPHIERWDFVEKWNFRVPVLKNSKTYLKHIAKAVSIINSPSLQYKIVIIKIRRASHELLIKWLKMPSPGKLFPVLKQDPVRRVE